MKSKCTIFLVFVTVLILFSAKSIPAVQVTVPGVTAYGYNTIPPPDWPTPGVIGCGPTTGTMILKYYTDTAPAPGLIGVPLQDARTMRSPTYMDVDSGGFGPSSKFQFGLEKFAHDRGYIVDAILHMNSTIYNYYDWSVYTVGPDLLKDANFYTNTWTIDPTNFLNFLKTEIDAGRPVSVTVDSDGNGGVDNNGVFLGTDHWMVAVGYDIENGQWAGYNTWDNGTHWYDVTSGIHTGETQSGGGPGSGWVDVNADGIYGNDDDYYYKTGAGDIMGVGYVRTFNYLGPIEIIPTVPEPTTILLIGSGLIGLWGFRKKFKK
jgi:hypothetical protein